MSGFDAWMNGEPFPPLTREERIQAYYDTFAGPYPGPNRAAIAAICAHRLVELEDRVLDPGAAVSDKRQEQT